MSHDYDLSGMLTFKHATHNHATLKHEHLNLIGYSSVLWKIENWNIDMCQQSKVAFWYGLYKNGKVFKNCNVFNCLRGPKWQKIRRFLENGLLSVVMSVLPLAVENTDVIWVRKLLLGSVITVMCSSVVNCLYQLQPFFIFISWLLITT